MKKVILSLLFCSLPILFIVSSLRAERFWGTEEPVAVTETQPSGPSTVNPAAGYVTIRRDTLNFLVNQLPTTFDPYVSRPGGIADADTFGSGSTDPAMKEVGEAAKSAASGRDIMILSPTYTIPGQVFTAPIAPAAPNIDVR